MLPILNAEKAAAKKYIVDFKGLNLGEGWQDGQLADSTNVSSALYPCLTQRYGRTLCDKIEWGDGGGSVEAIANKNGLIIVQPPVLRHKGNMIEAGLDFGPKKIASVGDYVLIFPDKIWYNAETGECGTMEPEIAVTGAVFTDSAISADGVTFPFRTGDAVTVSGCTAAENNKVVIIRGVEGGKLTFYENTLTAGTESGTITLKREVPDLDVVCESNYRLWGAKGSTIYGSKYGDPMNFNCFDGLASDSYAIEVGTEGDFTGAAAYGNHVCFFKESCLHKLYGTKPANFQVNTSFVHGVQMGSERSLASVNETLYYKGVNGVYTYSGGVPELISSCFGTRRFRNACASSDGDRYYIAMQDAATGMHHLMVYDVLRGIWLREDDLRCADMTFAEGYVWLLTEDGLLYKVDPAADRNGMEWSITLCPFNETVNERKGYSKFMVRAEMAKGAWLKLEYKRDNGGVWQEAFAVVNTKGRTMWFPVLPERCDCVQIRVSGKGECVLRTFVREFYTGSDI